MHTPVSRAIVAVALLSTTGCFGPDVEGRAREAAADIQASIRDYDGPALNQVVDGKIVAEVQTNLTALDEYKGEINGQIDGVLVNAIQAFQRSKNEDIPWWRSWERAPSDGLITEELRREIAAAASS